MVATSLPLRTAVQSILSLVCGERVSVDTVMLVGVCTENGNMEHPELYPAGPAVVNQAQPDVSAGEHRNKRDSRAKNRGKEERRPNPDGNRSRSRDSGHSGRGRPNPRWQKRGDAIDNQFKDLQARSLADSDVIKELKKENADLKADKSKKEKDDGPDDNETTLHGLAMSKRLDITWYDPGRKVRIGVLVLGGIALCILGLALIELKNVGVAEQILYHWWHTFSQLVLSALFVAILMLTYAYMWDGNMHRLYFVKDFQEAYGQKDLRPDRNALEKVKHHCLLTEWHYVSVDTWGIRRTSRLIGSSEMVAQLFNIANCNLLLSGEVARERLVQASRGTSKVNFDRYLSLEGKTVQQHSVVVAFALFCHMKYRSRHLSFFEHPRW